MLAWLCWRRSVPILYDQVGQLVSGLLSCSGWCWTHGGRRSALLSTVPKLMAAEALLVTEEAVSLFGWASGQGTQLHGLWSQVGR